MQVTRVLKLIVSCFHAAKFYTMHTLAHQARLGAAIEMETIAGRLHRSGHVYMDDLFALCAVRPCRCVCLSVCLGMAKLDPAGCVILRTHAQLDTRTHTYISANGSCQHDSYKDNTNVTDVCRAGQEMFSLSNDGATETNISQAGSRNECDNAATHNCSNYSIM